MKKDEKLIKNQPVEGTKKQKNIFETIFYIFCFIVIVLGIYVHSLTYSTGTANSSIVFLMRLYAVLFPTMLILGLLKLIISIYKHHKEGALFK